MPLSQRDVEKHLWDASNILRGSVDASEFKNFIVGLLFLKRLSDVFDEESLDDHTYQIPKEAHWRAIPRLWYQDVGNHLKKISELLEKKNPSLEGILTTIDFARLPSETLIRLISHLDKLRLGNKDLVDPDLLGRAYEYLIAKFAEKSKLGGEFYTPHNVVRLLIELLEPQEKMWICDPTSGSGGLLIQSMEYLRRIGKDYRTLSLFGQEKNHQTWGVSKINMILHGFDARLEVGDTIRKPKLVRDGRLLLFDIVIANPPFSLKDWGRESAVNDPFKRFKFGIPPNNFGDLAFLQHMLSTLRSNGRMGIILPHGVLFRSGTERKIRKALVEGDILETIIGLPPNLFFGTSIPACILVLNKNKEEGRKRTVLFINAFNKFDARPSQNILRLRDIQKIVATYREYTEYSQFSRIVPVKEIRDMSYNLNIPLYVDITPPEAPIDLPSIWKGFQLLENQRNTQIEEIERVLEHSPNLGSLSASNLIPETWFMGRLGDLITLETGKRAKGGALKVGKVASIGGEHINHGLVHWDKIKYIPEGIYNELSQGKVTLGDILVVKDGATTGKVAFIRSLPFERTAVNEHVFLVRSNDPTLLNTEYLYYVLASEIGQTQIRKRYHGIIGGINRTDFRSLQIPLPPLKEQLQIVKVLSSIESLFHTTQQVASQATTLKKGLMQRLLSGRVRVD